ncbi:DUF523 domain-containing protein [uncultured Veillonella sp.]|uniref:DUF523 domain-containing protein n=1 Tax=uncultured Veillonella sp. TaxID=159268 RepID=UPI0025F673A3|nr:DUF523 domain-containing protein [uncultured Veillonella sp.]
MKAVKRKILCSACLLGEHCKYNGGHNYSQKLADFLDQIKHSHPQDSIQVIPVCPEELGGLPTSRVPAEIVNGIVINREGQSVDQEFRLGAKIALQIALDEGVELAILQSRSPSCGVNEIYDGTFAGKRIKGSGIFAILLKEHKIKVLDIEDLRY